VYVTHDQEEALTMSDRIAVMNNGIVEQCAGPREIYEHPTTAFVAGFIGTSNIVNMRIDRHLDGNAVMDLSEGQRIVARSDKPSGTLQITVRPEKIQLRPDGLGDDASSVGGRIADVMYLGSMTQITVELPNGDTLTVHRLNDEAATADPQVGDTISLHWAAENSFVIEGLPSSADGGSTPAHDAPASE
jgi:spermidine/putrescine transport system ATP-binding protein